MEILRLERGDQRFYDYLGPVFGSRVVEKDTGDRFYDDADKIWYVVPGRGAASVRQGLLRNFWAADRETADRLVEALWADNPRLGGVAPRRYEQAFVNCGFTVQGYRKNFIEVYMSEKD